MKKTWIPFFVLLCAYGTAAAHSPKISSGLSELLDECAASGGQGVRDFSISRNLKALQGNNVEVVAELQPGKTIGPALLKKFNAVVKNQYRNLAKIQIPAGQLDSFADYFSEITEVRFPARPHRLVTTPQGTALTGAALFQNEGYTGTGVKIAIIDLGFSGYTGAQATGDLPSNVITYDYTGSGVGTGDDHGAGVAEIIYSMAPGAQLYFMKIDDETSLGSAETQCKALGVNVINHSVGWLNQGPGDGTGVIDNVANDAYDNGIVWVNSAGNYAQNHWQGVFTDANSNSWNEFIPSDESNAITAPANSYVYIYMRWNDNWNNSTQDYDLYLYNSNNAQVAVSRARQNGASSSHPIEEIDYYSKNGGTYYIKIKSYHTTKTCTIDLFTTGSTYDPVLTYQTSAGSIIEPADSAKVLAAGAISYANWSAGPIEYFSSQGPTIDNRVKPDISGPDGVATFTYPSFFGTSAAAPCAAGAAGLIFNRNSKYTPADVINILEMDATDMGAPGKDNVFGAGRLSLSESPPNAPSNPLCGGQANPAGVDTNKPVFSWTFSDPDLPFDGQQAFQVIVSSLPASIVSGTGDMWDSGRIVSTAAQKNYGGPALLQWTTYYWAVRAWDEFSATGPFCSAQTFCLSGPAPVPIVRDGINSNEDLVFTFSTFTLSANWGPSIDPENGITGYQYAIGTSTGSHDIAGWTTLGNMTQVTNSSLSLNVGTTYYFSIKAINGAGLQSIPANTNGQFVVATDTHDTTPPADITAVQDGAVYGADISVTKSLSQLSSNWSSSSDTESGITAYWYEIGSSPSVNDILDWTNNGPATSVTRKGLSLAGGTTYYFSVMAENGVGLYSSVTASNGQCVEPEVLPALNGAVSVSNVTSAVVTISWSTNKPTTGQVEYGLTTVYGNTVVADSTFTSTHVAELTGLQAGETYHYRIKSFDQDGNELISGDYAFSTLTQKSPGVLVYPNPLNLTDNQKAKFRVSESDNPVYHGWAGVKIFDISGNMVKQLSAVQGAGEIDWDGKNEEGGKAASGVYLCAVTDQLGAMHIVKLGVIK